MSAARICLTPRLRGVGGMVSFQAKLSAGLQRRGIQVGYELDGTPYQAVLVIGGTRQLGALWRARQQGARLVQRLDGFNWLHRIKITGKPGSGLRHYLRAESGNLLLRLIRGGLAQRLVYQSAFARDWWQRSFGAARAPGRVIHNGVDLAVFSPDGPETPPPDVWRILVVEGSLGGGYELGLENAVRLGEVLQGRLARPLEIVIAGRVAEATRLEWEQRSRVRLVWAGLVPHAHIPALDRGAHLLFSADLNAACPNSVIEALACGLPVLAFATGALPELVSPAAGCVTPYGGDPWKLEPPDIPALAQAAETLFAGQGHFRHGARQRAEQAFDLETMTDRYIEALLE